MTKFARRMDRIEVSGIRRIFDLARQMTDGVDFSLGQPDFDVPAPIRKAMIGAIEGGRNKYTVTQGLHELNDRLRRHLEAHFGLKGGGTIVTAGAAGALFLALGVLIDEGDEVIVPDPYFVLYNHLIGFFGGTPVLCDTYPDFRVHRERLEKVITPRTKVILFNNPVNPTGIAYTKAEVEEVAAVARKRGILVISDEIYSEFSYDFPHESFLKHDPHALLVSGFSKTYAMPGWRLGFAAGPSEIVEKMAMLQQSSFVCANAPGQVAAIAALDTDMGARVAEYRRKRDMVCAGLKDRFEIVKPQGAFYVFPKCPWGTDEEFVRKAVESKVLVVPGSAASRHNTHFRLSFAVSDSVLERGIGILNTIAKR